MTLIIMLACLLVLLIQSILVYKCEIIVNCKYLYICFIHVVVTFTLISVYRILKIMQKHSIQCVF